VNLVLQPFAGVVLLHWYFVFVDSMKALDLVTMKKLDSKVNIIPVIAKADTITKTELQKFKAKVSFHIFSLDASIYLLEVNSLTTRLCLSYNFADLWQLELW